MGRFFTQAEAKSFAEADDSSVIPPGDYRMKIVAIDPKEDDPDVRCFKLKVLDGPYKGRIVRTWASTAPDRMWAFKKMMSDIVVDPNQLQLEDIEGHVFKVNVNEYKRKDNGETANGVVRLSPWDGDDERVPWDEDDD